MQPRVMRFDYRLLVVLVGIAAIAVLWVFVSRSDTRIDGSAPTGQAFLDSFPNDSQCKEPAPVDGASLRYVECPSGITYMWFDRPLPQDYAQTTVPRLEFQCQVHSGSTVAWVRFSTAAHSTLSTLNSLIQDAANSFAGETSMIGPECP